MKLSLEFRLPAVFNPEHLRLKAALQTEKGAWR